MKKLFSLLLVLIMISGLCACSGGVNKMEVETTENEITESENNHVSDTDQKLKKDPARTICISEGIHSEYTKFEYTYDMDSDNNPEIIQMNISENEDSAEQILSVDIGDYHQEFDVENGIFADVYICDIDITDHKKNLAFITSETHGYSRMRILYYEPDLPVYKFCETEKKVGDWAVLWYSEFAVNEDNSITISAQTSIPLGNWGVDKTYDLDKNGIFMERKTKYYEIKHDFTVKNYEEWYNSVKDIMFKTDMSEKDREMLRKGYMKAYRTLSADNFEIKKGEYFKTPYDDGKSKVFIEKENGESAWVEFDLTAFGELNQYFFPWGF